LLALVAAPQRSVPARSVPAAGATAKAFPFATEVHTLPNGLRLVLIPYDSPGLVAYYTLMRVGSRNEPEPGRSGYAHFFEHMMFRGTKKHPAVEYNATVTRLGLDTNAYTELDQTVYHLYGPAKALPTIIDYESDRFQNLDYDEGQFKTEAGAILGEFDKADTLAQLTRSYSGWKGKLDTAPIPREPRQNGSRRATVSWKAPTIPRLYMAWHGRAADDLHAAAVQAVLAPYLFGETSAVYQELVLKRQIVDTISTQDGVSRDPYLLGAVIRVTEEKNLRQAE